MKEQALSSLNVSKAKENQFARKNITNVEELLCFLPNEVQEVPYINALTDEALRCNVVGFIGKAIEKKVHPRSMSITFVLESGQWLSVVLFNGRYIFDQVRKGGYYYIVGKMKYNLYTKEVQVVHPDLLVKYVAGMKLKNIISKYPVITGMSKKYLEDKLEKAIECIPKQETLPLAFVNKHQLISKARAYQFIHFPDTLEEYELGLKRHTYELLYQQAEGMIQQERENKLESEYYPKTTGIVETIKEELPFDLTEGQQEVLDQFFRKSEKGERINALLQGDVGSGKTITAILLMVAFVDAGYQVAMLAPTGVLAKQHYEEIVERLAKYDITIAFLNTETKAKERRKIIKETKEGTLDILVGTHSILNDEIEFKDLAVTVVDEEHRFGVQQREELANRSNKGVHMIRMSATPIPRSLALTIYSTTTEIYSITSLPKGRKPIKTAFLNDDKRVQAGIQMQIEQGHQVYIVCPLIEESNADIMEDVLSVEETYEKFKKVFADSPHVKIGVLNGKMKPEEMKEVLEQYERNEINLLISTTVIEVGINVPNATMIVIQNAERFGLAQLHQLRGRVGRSSLQSYCVLQSPKGCTERLYAMTETTDGFEIAEIDFELRGGGDLLGVKQSGKTEQLRIITENLPLYEKILEEIQGVYA